MSKTFHTLLQIATSMADKGDIFIDPSLRYNSTDTLIKEGVETLGNYHKNRPLIFDAKGNLTTQDLPTLIYYRNRLSPYDHEFSKPE